MEIDRTCITGALGYLGFNYLSHMARMGRRSRIYALDVREPDEEQKELIERLRCENESRPEVVFLKADLTGYEEDWAACIDDSESLIHFAAVNPFPSQTPIQASKSMDITLNVMTAALRSASMKRFIFASSNHVMGGYKDSPLADSIGVGGLTTSLDPAPGTLIWEAGPNQNSTTYAWTKLMGERLCQSCAATGSERLSFVSVRIGACKPGQGFPEMIAGRMNKFSADREAMRDLTWMRSFWLSQRDFQGLFDRAQEADCDGWPSRAVIVNGMSANSGMKWSLEEVRGFLGYTPVDDVSERIG
ncbi:MAG: NAD(P)-dependent oxidoreductase [Verrucomicrobiota bacterium]